MAATARYVREVFCSLWPYPRVVPSARPGDAISPRSLPPVCRDRRCCCRPSRRRSSCAASARPSEPGAAGSARRARRLHAARLRAAAPGGGGVSAAVEQAAARRIGSTSCTPHMPTRRPKSHSTGMRIELCRWLKFDSAGGNELPGYGVIVLSSALYACASEHARPRLI